MFPKDVMNKVLEVIEGHEKDDQEAEKEIEKQEEGDE